MIRLRSISLSWHLIYLAVLGFLFVLFWKKESPSQDKTHAENYRAFVELAGVGNALICEKIIGTCEADQSEQNNKVKWALQQANGQFGALRSSWEELEKQNYSNRILKQDIDPVFLKFKNQLVSSVDSISMLIKQASNTDDIQPQFAELKAKVDSLVNVYTAAKVNKNQYSEEINALLLRIQTTYTFALNELIAESIICSDFYPIFSLKEQLPRAGDSIHADVFLVDRYIGQDNITIRINGNPIPTNHGTGHFSYKYDTPGLKKIGMQFEVKNPLDQTVKKIQDTVSIRILPR
jgi:hypothetical protein